VGDRVPDTGSRPIGIEFYLNAVTFHRDGSSIEDVLAGNCPQVEVIGQRKRIERRTCPSSLNCIKDQFAGAQRDVTHRVIMLGKPQDRRMCPELASAGQVGSLPLTDT
jgi:hypothetical protein